MRIVVALGGNALLRRGEPMTADNQRANIRIATEQIAKIHSGNELVIAHGNGPQVGLLSLQAAAYTSVSPYPLDVLGAETEGMIGYIIEQELGNLLDFEVPFATLLTQVEVDANDPAFQKPSKPIGPVYTKAEAEKLAAEKKPLSHAEEDRRPESPAFSLLSFVFCILGGTLLGRVSVPLGSLGSIALGTTGGALLFALGAGSFDRIGPFQMKMDKKVLSAIRSISLGFFLAIVGLNAGGGVVKAFLEHGILLIAVGIGAALAAEMTGFILGHYLWKINWIILAGAICGAMTSTPGLGAAIDATGTDEVSAGYGGAYPVAIVCMVLFTTLLHSFFH